MKQSSGKIRAHWDLAAYLFILSYLVLTSALSLLRYAHFRSIIGDLAVYSQAIWYAINEGSMQVTLLAFTHETQGALPFFSLHVSPVLALLAPLFKFLPLPTSLIVLKCALIAAAAVMLYKISKYYVSQALSFGIVLLFLFSPNSLSAVHDSFHLDYFGPIFMFTAFYFFIRTNFALFVAAIVLFVMIKESYIPTPLAFCFLALLWKRSLRWALAPAVIVLVYGVAVHFLMDSLHARYLPDPEQNFRPLFFSHFNPAYFFTAFFENDLGGHLWFFLQGSKAFTFFTWAFVLWCPQLVINLALELPFGDHYGTLLSAVMIMTLPIAFKNLQALLRKIGVPGNTVLWGIVGFGILTSYGSLKILNPRHYEPNKHMEAQKKALQLVPPTASVTTSEMYAPFFSTRHQVDCVGHEKRKRHYDYVFLDLNRENNTHIEWPVVQGYWRPYLESSSDYRMIFNEDNIRVYAKSKGA